VPEQLLTILKLCLLALLYLFFLRVIRAVWVEVNGPRVRSRSAPAPAASAAAVGSRQGARAKRKAGGPPGPALVVVAPAEQKGRVYPLTEELTMGRAAGCQVTLDDTYVSQIHARVFVREGQVYVEDLGSTNGTYLNRGKVAGPMLLGPGDQLQVGSTVLELA
jgi:pSer/pThr/pTyr-binding forkhead associated (FHA) protein